VLSILKLEVSLTQVFDRPVHGRQFFEEVIRDNLDLGRPDRVQLLFERRISRRTPGRFATRILTDGVQPSIRFDYKRTSVKQYFKAGRALRTETTFHDTLTSRSARRSAAWRVAQHCAISAETVEHVVLPTRDTERAPALRWGQPRTMALFAAICGFADTATGFTPHAAAPRRRPL